jgi:hypothetical protein
MTKFMNPLNNIKIASPCNTDWNEMIGNERRRFCDECKLNVYNLSGMSQGEAENLLLNSEGRLCIRFYKRADGNVLTKDCPVGWKAIKQRVSKMATALASLVFAALSGIGLTNYFAKSNEQQIAGKVTLKIENSIMSESVNENSNVAVPEKSIPMMGNVSISSDGEYTLSNGGMSNLEAVRSQIKQHRKR